jgi:hypothetical protein
MSMKSKGVSFNLDDRFQADMFAWAEDQTNFSGYVKRMIQDDPDFIQYRESKKKPPVIRSSNTGGIKIKIGE